MPRKSVVRLTDRPDMTLDVYRGRKIIQQYNIVLWHYCENEHTLWRFLWLSFYTSHITVCPPIRGNISTNL